MNISIYVKLESNPNGTCVMLSEAWEGRGRYGKVKCFLGGINSSKRAGISK
jgi:hypothetical protein